jgi:hypothetical protein
MNHWFCHILDLTWDALMPVIVAGWSLWLSSGVHIDYVLSCCLGHHRVVSLVCVHVHVPGRAFWKIWIILLMLVLMMWRIDRGVRLVTILSQVFPLSKVFFLRGQSDLLILAQLRNTLHFLCSSELLSMPTAYSISEISFTPWVDRVSQVVPEISQGFKLILDHLVLVMNQTFHLMHRVCWNIVSLFRVVLVQDPTKVVISVFFLF